MNEVRHHQLRHINTDERNLVGEPLHFPMLGIYSDYQVAPYRLEQLGEVRREECIDCCLIG